MITVWASGDPGQTLKCRNRYCHADASASGPGLMVKAYEGTKGPVKVMERIYRCPVRHRFAVTWTESEG